MSSYSAMASRKVRNWSPVPGGHRSAAAASRGRVGDIGDVRKTVLLRATLDTTLWIVAWTLRTDLADSPPPVPLRLPSVSSFTYNSSRSSG